MTTLDESVGDTHHGADAARYPRGVRFYFWSRRALGRALVWVQAAFDGLWLGVLDRELLHGVNTRFYDRQRQYHSEAFNRSGLFGWERAAIDAWFSDCRRLLVAAAGGGREMIALSRGGYEVDGFECHPALVPLARRLLEEEGLGGRVDFATPDRVPDGRGGYDGIIVGWAAYMYITGKGRRVAFLRDLRARATPGAPLLVSFFARRPENRRFRTTFRLASLVRRLSRKPPVELGDSFEPEFLHYFTREEIGEELREAGFEVVHYDARDYGHLVARALPDLAAPQKRRPAEVSDSG